LVDSATGVFGIQIGDEARGELISHGDGTPGLVVSGLQCLRVQWNRPSPGSGWSVRLLDRGEAQRRRRACSHGSAAGFPGRFRSDRCQS
jgi:hypothetical protein